MSTKHQCAECGAALPADAPQGLCPQCLLKRGLTPDSQADTLTAAPGQRPVPPAPSELARHFPQLEILELLGQGAMGTVYKARQPRLDRLVALKILSPQLAAKPEFKERFAREARALAKLNHPNIVAVYDFGEVDGLFYFVMEYVDGANLRHVQRSGRLPPPAVLAIVPQICEALQYAHDQGIVHRDIKPENVLLDKRGRVKIADFGLAKILGRESIDYNLTGTREVMGTARYMAPEQLERPLEVDHRADIFSLGVVFYEMLTGEIPAGRFAPPSQKVRIDVRLDEVVLHAMEKEPDRRYQRASEVKTDVDSIQAGVKPKIPMPTRRKAVLAAVAGCAVVLGICGAPWLIRFAHNQALLMVQTTNSLWQVSVLQEGKEICRLDPSNHHRAMLRPGEYSLSLTADRDDLQLSTSRVMLRRGAKQSIGVEDLPTVDRPLRVFRGHRGAVFSVAVSPDGQYAVSGGLDATVRLWDMATGQERRRLTSPDWVGVVAFSPDGRQIVSGGGDSTVRIWDSASGHEQHHFHGSSPVNSLAFTPDGHQIICSFWGDVVILDVDTGRPRRQFAATGGRITVLSNPHNFLLSGKDKKGLIRLYDWPSGRELRRFMDNPDYIENYARVTPDERYFISDGADNSLKLWELNSGKIIRYFRGHQDWVACAAVSPDGRTMVSGGYILDSTIRWWDIGTGKLIRRFTGHTDGVLDVAFSPDGRTALSGSQDGTMRLWDLSYARLSSGSPARTNSNQAATAAANPRVVAPIGNMAAGENEPATSRVVQHKTDPGPAGSVADGIISPAEYGQKSLGFDQTGGQSFSGGLSSGRIFVDSDTDSVQFALSGVTIGVGGASSGDMILVYLDTRPGGLSGSTVWSETVDLAGGAFLPHERDYFNNAINPPGTNGTIRFPFNADYVLVVDGIGFKLLEFSNSGELVDISPGVGFSGSDVTAGQDIELDIPLAHLGLAPGASFKFVALLANGLGIVSDESIPGDQAGYNESGNLNIRPGDVALTRFNEFVVCAGRTEKPEPIRP